MKQLNPLDDNVINMIDLLEKLFADDDVFETMSYWDPSVNGGKGGEFKSLFLKGVKYDGLRIPKNNVDNTQ